MKVIFILYTIVFVCLIRSRYNKPVKGYHVLIKGCNSLGFVIAAVYCGMVSGNYGFCIKMLPGFLFCMIGDIFLAVKDKRHGKVLFMAGLLSFLSGHIAFLLVFQTIVPVQWYEFVFPVLMLAAAWRIIHLKVMDMQGADIPVLIYAFFVSLLLSKAVFMGIAEGFSMRYQLITAGSLLFWLSDFLILFIIFCKKKFGWGHFVNLLTYYYGLLLLAFSIFYQ